MGPSGDQPGLPQAQRLLRTGVEPQDLGGPEADRERLVALLVDAGVIEETLEGTLRLTGQAAAELRSAVASMVPCGLEVARTALEGGVAGDAEVVSRLLDEWASPVRVAAATVVRSRVKLGPGALIAGSELTARLALAGLLGSVVTTGGTGVAGEPFAEVDPDQLLSLLLFSGILLEREDGELELTDVFLAFRDRQRVLARGWKAARRRELLGQLLLVEGGELSEAFRLAGFPDSVAELVTLHRFAAVASLPLWTAWQTLSAFDRPFEDVSGDGIDDWMVGEVIVMISSPSSSPAQQLEAVLAEAVRGQGLPVAVVNADNERALCERFGVDRPPMLLLLRDGQELARTVWSPAPLALRAFIDETFGGSGATRREHLPMVQA